MKGNSRRKKRTSSGGVQQKEVRMTRTSDICGLTMLNVSQIIF